MLPVEEIGGTIADNHKTEKCGGEVSVEAVDEEILAGVAGAVVEVLGGMEANLRELLLEFYHVLFADEQDAAFW